MRIAHLDLDMLVDNLSSLLRELSVSPRALLLEIFIDCLQEETFLVSVCWIQLIGGCSFNITIVAH